MRKEPYITQRKTKTGVTYQVRVRVDDADVVKSFNVKDYPSPKIALNAAIQFRNRTLYEISNRDYIRRTESTVEDMFNYYLDNTTDSFKTKDYHQKLFRKYVLHKQTKIQQLTKADIQDDLNKMVEVASNDTIGRVYSVWRDDIVGSALMQDIITRDVTLGVRKPESHVITTRRGTVTDRETLLKVEGEIQKSVSNKYDAKVIVCLLETLYYTGMRPAEVEVLTRQDIHRDYISVTKELGSSLDEKYTIRRPKTPSSVRNVPIHQNLKPILRELMDYAETDNIFARQNGEYMSSTWISNIIRRACKRVGVEFNMYRLRHNMATSLVTNKVDSITTMELLGHAHYDMSLYYANSNDELKEEAIGLIS